MSKSSTPGSLAPVSQAQNTPELADLFGELQVISSEQPRRQAHLGVRDASAVDGHGQGQGQTEVQGRGLMTRLSPSLVYRRRKGLRGKNARLVYRRRFSRLSPHRFFADKPCQTGLFAELAQQCGRFAVTLTAPKHSSIAVTLATYPQKFACHRLSPSVFSSIAVVLTRLSPCPKLVYRRCGARKKAYKSTACGAIFAA